MSQIHICTKTDKLATITDFLYNRTWLEGELEVVTVKKQAKQSLENLMDDRKTISDQINKAKVDVIYMIIIVSTTYVLKIFKYILGYKCAK